MQLDFHSIWGRLALPVIVCKNTPDWPIEYMNTRAGLLFSPSYSVKRLRGEEGAQGCLSDILRFQAQEEYQTLRSTAAMTGRIDEHHCEIGTFDQKSLSVALSGVSLAGDAEDEYFALYISVQGSGKSTSYDSQLSALINASLVNADEQQSIQSILALAGQLVDVSRVYIFEEISPTTTRNTYEWCAPGAEPAIDSLQSLEKADYNYDVIVESGMYIADNVDALPDGDRAILQEQGIRALAIVTFYENSRPLGYVGFDDCEKARHWQHDEVEFLKSVSGLLGMLIIRRNAEQRMHSTQNVLRLISDNSDEIIYANRLDDYALLFVNQALCMVQGKTAEQLLGRPCYEALQGQERPCTFCPIPKVCWTPGKERSSVYTWEHYNEHVNKTYLARDNIVRWPDGSYAHIETAIDISQRTEYETLLRRLATTDTMTGIANREWGAIHLVELLDGGQVGSLCFFDVDGLKSTNDTFGHAVGDELLRETVRLVNSRLNGDDFLCRWGGDEFLIWMHSVVEEAEETIRQIERDMAEYNAQYDKPFKLAISFGVIAFEGTGKDLDALVTVADKRMYEHKMSKRDRLFRRRRDDRLIT